MSNLPAPIQPQHNTLNVYRTLPLGCIAFIVKDHHCMPFIRPGECVVVDTDDRTPRKDDIYVIGWEGGKRDICQARHTNHTFADGQTVWMVGSMKRSDPAALQRFLESGLTPSGGIPQWNGAWSEGPFTFDHLESKLVGAVIGLYEPKVDDMIRNAGKANQRGGK